MRVTDLPGLTASALPTIRLLRFEGDAQTRGRGHATSEGADARAVREATIGQVETARTDGLLDAEAEAYLANQRTFHVNHDPGSLAELRGIAGGFEVPEADLFAFHHLSLLRARRARPEPQHDGCSTWGISHGPDGPLLVKNRDISGTDFGLQRVMTHSGPDIPAGRILCVGSLGSPAGYSSGINAWGFALADTYVPAPTAAVGWLRYFLMTRLLTHCQTVPEAVAMIEAAPHAGGGTLVVADASGAIAAVDFASIHPTITSGELVWRTNHYPNEGAIHEPGQAEDTIASTSRARYAFLARTLPSRRWSVSEAASLMATHTSPQFDGPSLCAHRAAGTSRTLSCAIYACRKSELYFSDGNPCDARWGTATLGETTDSHTTATHH